MVQTIKKVEVQLKTEQDPEQETATETLKQQVGAEQDP